jgi:hypothetical protein
MPLFVVLGNWTQKRMETIKELPANIKAGRAVFESYGVKILNMVFTLGRYARLPMPKPLQKRSSAGAVKAYSAPKP